MPSRYSEVTNRRQRAYEHGTERSEFFDVGQIIARNYAQKKVCGTNMTKCARCGGYYTKEQKDLHDHCPIAQIPAPKPKEPSERNLFTKTAAKSNSSQKQLQSRAQRPKKPFNYSGTICVLRVSVALVSNGETTQAELGYWSSFQYDADFITKDENLLKRLANKLRSRYNPATTTISSASAQRIKPNEAFPLNSSRLSEFFQTGKT